MKAVVRFDRGFLALVVLGMAVLTVQAEPLSPPDFEEGWYVVAMRDPKTEEYQQCGHMHNIFKRVGDEVHSETSFRFGFRRGAAVMEVTATQLSRETLGGRPLGFEHSMAFGTEPQTQRGTIEDGTLTLVTEQFGVEKDRKTYPFDPEIKFAWGLMLQQHEHGTLPGTTFKSKIYEPSMKPDGPMEVSITVHGKELVEVLGKKRRLIRITTSMMLGSSGEAGSSLPGGVRLPAEGMQIDTDNWVDDDLNPIIMTMDLGMIKMKFYKTSKKEALERGAPPEMFLNTFVRTDKRIGAGAKRVKLRLRLKKGAKDPMPTLPRTEMQTFERISDREAILTLRRIDWDQVKRVEATGEYDPKLEAYLAASAVCDAKDRKIRRLSRKAVRGKETPADKADALRRFVTKYITNKGMTVGFATASEVARNRSGDCTEHGVLLAALARAAGLPARGVGGIVEVPSGLVGGEGQSAFGYHMWTQVYIGGKWVDIDAAMRQTDCDPTHVAISLMPLGEEGMVNSVMSLIPLLGQLEIEVLEVER